MPDYVAAVCHRDDQGEFVPAESIRFATDTDNEAIQKAVLWRVETISAVDPDRKAWLQVLRDRVSALSQEVGLVDSAGHAHRSPSNSRAESFV